MFFVAPPHNPGFALSLNANASIAPPRVSSFDDNGNIVSHNIVTTNGYTAHLRETPTTVMPQLITLDKRQNHLLWWKVYDELDIDPDKFTSINLD